MKISYTAGIALVIVCAASPAAAQFTAAVVPPERVVVKDTTTPKDSARKARVVLEQRMSDMKAWVDSAAVALASRPDSVPPETTVVRAESTVAAPVRASPDSVTAVASGEVVDERSGTTKFRPGAPAPETATPLPLFAVAGATMLALGLLLLRR
ncbi:MAG TPA: hypothetical protein VF041_22960 [Gemmatimonadaceae bacterium]